MLRRLGTALAFVLVFAALGALGYWLLFSNFATYTTRAHPPLGARNSRTAALRRRLQSIRAGVYVFTEIIQRIAGPVDHTLARLLTLAFWLGAAGSCARLVLRQTASRRLALFTLSATFLYLIFLPDEPFHPGGLIVFVLALSLWLLDRAIEAGRWTAMAAIAGATIAVLTHQDQCWRASTSPARFAWAARYTRGHARCVTALWIIGALGLSRGVDAHAAARKLGAGLPRAFHDRRDHDDLVSAFSEGLQRKARGDSSPPRARVPR